MPKLAIYLLWVYDHVRNFVYGIVFTFTPVDVFNRYIRVMI